MEQQHDDYFQDMPALEVILQYFGQMSLPSFFEDESEFDAIRERNREAVVEGRANEVASILESHPELAHDAHDFTGEANLNLAAANGSIEVIELLLDYNADIEGRDHTHLGLGKTPLISAASEGQVESVKCLIDHGAQINAVASAQMVSPQALHDGATEEDIKFIQHDGQNGKWNDRNWTALMHGASDDNVAMCAALLMRGADCSRHSKWGKSAMDLATDPLVHSMLEFAKAAQVEYDLGRPMPLELTPEAEAAFLEEAPQGFNSSWRTALLFIVFCTE